MNKGLFYIRMKSIALVLIIGLISVKGISQKKNFLTDSVHSPRKATIYSAVLPGLGQAYNKKYWKIPIVYAAIGGCLTAAIINNRDYKLKKEELVFRSKNNGAFKYLDYDDFLDANLLEYANYSRKWRDNMFIFTGVAYMLNIIDANVDAHLFNFDVSEDLSLNVLPYTYSQEFNTAVVGLSFRFNFR